MTEKTVVPPQGAKEGKKEQGIVASTKDTIASTRNKVAGWISAKDKSEEKANAAIAQNAGDLAGKLDAKIENKAAVQLTSDQQIADVSRSNDMRKAFTLNLIDDIKRKRNIADPEDGVIFDSEFIAIITNPEAVKEIRTPYERMVIKGEEQEVGKILKPLAKEGKGGRYQDPEILESMTKCRGILSEKLIAAKNSPGEFQGEFTAFELDVIFTTIDSKPEWQLKLYEQALLFATKNADKAGDNIGTVLGYVLKGLTETPTIIPGDFPTTMNPLIRKEPVCDWLKEKMNKREMEKRMNSETEILIRDEDKAKDAAFKILSLIGGNDPETEKKVAEMFEPIGREKTKQSIAEEFNDYLLLKNIEEKVDTALKVNQSGTSANEANRLVKEEISGLWWGARVAVNDRMKRVKELLKDANAGAKLDNDEAEKTAAQEKHKSNLGHCEGVKTKLSQQENAVEELKKNGASAMEIDAETAKVTALNTQLKGWLDGNGVPAAGDTKQRLEVLIAATEEKIERTTADLEDIKQRIAIRESHKKVTEPLNRVINSRKINRALATIDTMLNDREEDVKLIANAKREGGKTYREDLTNELKELKTAIVELRENLYPWSRIISEKKFKLSKINGGGVSRFDFLEAFVLVRELGTSEDDLSKERPEKRADWEGVRKWIYRNFGMPLSLFGGLVGLQIVGVAATAILAPHIALTAALYLAAANGAWMVIKRFFSNLKYWRDKHEMYRIIPLFGRPLGVLINTTAIWALIFVGGFNIFDSRDMTVKFLRNRFNLQPDKIAVVLDGKDKTPVWLLATDKTEKMDKDDVEKRYGVLNKDNKNWLLEQPHALRYFEKMTTGKDPMPVEKYTKAGATDTKNHLWKLNTAKADAFVAKLKAINKSKGALSEDDIHALEMGWVSEEFLYSRSIDDHMKKFGLSLSDAETLHKFALKNNWIGPMLNKGRDEWYIANMNAFINKIKSTNGELKMTDLVANNQAVDPTMVMPSTNVQARLSASLKIEENFDFVLANQEIVGYINEYRNKEYLIKDMDGVLTNIRRTVAAGKTLDTFNMSSPNFDPRYMTFMIDTGLIGLSAKMEEANKIRAAAGALSRNVSDSAEDVLKKLNANDEERQKVKAILYNDYIKPEKIKNTGIVKTAAGEYVIGEKDTDGANFRTHVMGILKQVMAEGQKTKEEAKTDQAAKKAELVKPKAGEPQVEPPQKNVTPAKSKTPKKPNDKKPKKGTPAKEEPPLKKKKT